MDDMVEINIIMIGGMMICIMMITIMVSCLLYSLGEDTLL
jgi:hypothetical protein